ncbi:TPA: hypothetical protein NJ223_004670 [Vibrio parahaemolyticus]|nr:hypothetical protein [Vibrio parahaemolyticus]
MSDRQDLSSSLVHLTRGATVDGNELTPVDVLLKILRERTIVGSTTDSGFIRGSRRAVCFQDAPLFSIAQNLKFEKELRQTGATRKRYSGCGLIFSKYYLFQNGCKPVIYDKVEDGEQYLSDDELYRLVKFDLSNTESFIDWTHEREWRMPDNFEFRIDWSCIVLETKADYREFIQKSCLTKTKVFLKASVEL